MSGGEFASIEARANAATEGPWFVKGMYPQEVLGNDDGLTLVATTHSSPDGPPSNTEFIAHAREDVPVLLAAVRERDNTIARVREVHARNYGFPTINAMRIPDSKPVVFCQSCQVDYPCATIAALDPQETP